MEARQGEVRDGPEASGVRIGLHMTIPELAAVDRLELRPGEVFLLAAGFEDRALAFPQVLRPVPGGRSKALLLDYRPQNKMNRLRELRSALRHKSCETEIIQYDRYNPGGFDMRLKDALSAIRCGAVCVDISSMSRLAILITADVARELDLPLRIVYAEALDYAPSEEDFENAKATGQQHLPTSFVHTGVYEVVRVPRLSSIRMQNQATSLIAFDSFNEALCQALVNVINPSRFILINGRPPRRELRWREHATAYVHERLREEWSIEDDNRPIRVTSTLYYEETYRLLAELYWKLSNNHRVILAPTGSKMQTVGSYLLRAVHDDVHVEYPTVEGLFADRYSTGVREKWELDLGNVRDLISRLRRKEFSDHLGLPEEPVDADID